MLDQTTKRKLDSARQILVGKVPDPKAQVEQITTALIYKFMDDMDKENEEVGLKIQFFIGDWKKFSWTKLLDNKLLGQERFDLYVQAITNMSKNSHIPQLFRDIFKGAFLPYNDPRTLSLFLKEINEFNYEHSENLGNAFEYLLSILGSQGDAGQFRTPRHIIDFIVEVVDPKKNETILDPACGTAGFLISAYKHILKNNDGKDNKTSKPTSKEKNLTPDEKLKLMNNLAGYDISPDMVKLALVNMYLHGFPEPKIHEYDTLSSEKRWDEIFDVILANPPFMTPRGGIVPHKRFSIQANRAEVLFVDYMVEHLTIKGRAGIIVPEGIIFQSNKAYTHLCKKLIEDGLFAVVSLPAGVFNPYAGVKTSILLFDNEISKKTKNFLFFKIQNDGFDLGVQRREHNKNDLPLALEIIKKYKLALNDKNFEFNENEKQIAHIVAKEKIIATGDYNLSGERYKETVVYGGKWEMVELGEVCVVDWGNTELTKKSYVENGEYLGVSAAGCDGRMKHFEHEIGTVVLSAIGVNCGRVFYPNEKFTAIKNTITFTPDKKKFYLKFLFYILKNNTLPRRGGGQPFMTKGDVEKYKIPLPPIEVQKEIVAELDGYQKIIGGAKQIIENYKPTIKINPSWEMVELGEVCSVQSGGTPSKNKKEYWEHGNIPWVGSTVCKDCFVDRIQQFITEEGLKNSSAKIFKPKTTLIALVGATIGKTAFLIVESATNQNIAGIYPKDDRMLLPEFTFYILQILYEEFMNLGSGKFRMANLSFIKILKIPQPPIDVQQQIVAQIESEQRIINENKKLIEIFETKIKDKIQEVWGE